MHVFFFMAAASCVLGLAPAHAQQGDIIAVARDTLADLQQNSFDAKREYCGLIGRNPRGEVVITRPRKGRADSCRPRNFWGNRIEVIASYHTHGSHDAYADAEVPSFDDLAADIDEGIYGFVSTPGGRFWITEPHFGRVRQLCGVGCLPMDPNYDPNDAGFVRQQYTMQQLLNREEGLDD